MLWIASTQPRCHPDVPESAAQQDEIIRGIAATEEEQLEAQQEVSEPSDSSDDDYLPFLRCLHADTMQRPAILAQLHLHRRRTPP